MCTVKITTILCSYYRCNKGETIVFAPKFPCGHEKVSSSAWIFDPRDQLELIPRRLRAEGPRRGACVRPCVRPSDRVRATLRVPCCACACDPACDRGCVLVRVRAIPQSRVLVRKLGDESARVWLLLAADG